MFLFFFFFESSTCPGYTHPSTKLPKCCSQTVSHHTASGLGILLLGPHCLESALHPRARPPGPSCHPADQSHQGVGGCTMGSGVSQDPAVPGPSHWMGTLRRRLSWSCVQLAVIGRDSPLWASLCCSWRQGHLAVKPQVWGIWLCSVGVEGGGNSGGLCLLQAGQVEAGSCSQLTGTSWWPSSPRPAFPRAW